MSSLKDRISVQANAAKTYVVNHKKVTLPVGLILGALVIYNVLGATAPEPVARPAPEKSWTVSTIDVSRGDQQPDITVFGEVAAAAVADLKPMVTGRIVELGPAFLDGAVVSQGDLLVAIDPFDYENAVIDAEARVADTTAQLDAERIVLESTGERLTLRQRDYDRRVNLQRQGSASEKAVDDALLALTDAQQSLASRESSVRQLEARLIQAEVTLARAQRDLEDTRVLAPFDGYVSGTSGAVGKRVTPNDTLARMFDSASLEARFQLSDSEFARLIGAPLPGEAEGDMTQAGVGLDGRLAEIQWDVGSATFSYNAVIERVSAELDTASGGFTAYARVTDHVLDDPLRPGAFVSVVIPDRVFEDSIVVPASAVMKDDLVYTVNGENRLDEHTATVLRRYGDEAIIRVDVPDGSALVTTNFPEIGPGVKVVLR